MESTAATSTPIVWAMVSGLRPSLLSRRIWALTESSTVSWVTGDATGAGVGAGMVVSGAVDPVPELIAVEPVVLAVEPEVCDGRGRGGLTARRRGGWAGGGCNRSFCAANAAAFADGSNGNVMLSPLSWRFLDRLTYRRRTMEC